MPTLDWNVNDCLKRCSPNIISYPQARGVDLNNLEAQDITFNDIVDAYKFMAEVVTIYGDKYLPIFERLHREIEEHKEKDELLELAKNITYKNLSTDNNDED